MAVCVKSYSNVVVLYNYQEKQLKIIDYKDITNNKTALESMLEQVCKTKEEVQIYLDEYVNEFDGMPYEADDESISVRYTYTHDENDPDADSDVLKIDVFRD